MITFHWVEYKNILSTGNVPIRINLNTHNTTLSLGKNGNGKCFCTNTPISIQNKKTGEIIETTIGELYAQEKQNNG
jgi:ABC-type branched-subunit amino acid transport system ATPase component